VKTHLPARLCPWSDDGEVVDRVAVGELFQRNGLLHLLLMKGWDRVFHPGEIVHLNDVEELPDSLAGAFPGFAAGDLVLSFRNLHMLMVVEPDGWTVKWRQMRPWIRQHDPDFEPDGTITVFDNRDDDTVEGSHLGGSRILAVAPRDGAVETLYGGRAGETVYTDIMGKQQEAAERQRADHRVPGRAAPRGDAGGGCRLGADQPI